MGNPDTHRQATLGGNGLVERSVTLMAALYRDLGAKSIIAVVSYPDNKASRALVEAFGFVHIGLRV